MEMFPTVEELSFCGEADYTAIFTELRQQKSSNVTELLWPLLRRVTFTPLSTTVGFRKATLSDIIRIIREDRSDRGCCLLCGGMQKRLATDFDL